MFDTPRRVIEMKIQFDVMKHMLDLLPLEPRRESKKSGHVRRGAHKPLAIRWFGMTALAGHLRHLLAVAAASNQLDLRDWMRPEEASVLLNRVSHILGALASGGSLAERLGREVWIDFVADTGDDHDVSLAVSIRSQSAPKEASGACCISMNSMSLCTWLRKRSSH